MEMLNPPMAVDDPFVVKLVEVVVVELLESKIEMEVVAGVPLALLISWLKVNEVIVTPFPAPAAKV